MSRLSEWMNLPAYSKGRFIRPDGRYGVHS
jgi:hypothetical protein